MMEQQINVTAERPFPQAAAQPSSQEGEAAELDAAAYGAEHALKALVEYQIESLRFLARRTHANLEFLRHLPHCKGWEELGALQRTWVKDCIADYGEEVGRFAGTSLQLATSDLLPLQWLLYRKPRRNAGNGRAG
jgi:hypothetical protein